MTKLIFNPNNSEGHHPSSFDFLDTEIRKDDKIVATDLTDLYDVELNNVLDGNIIVYDDIKSKWVNGEAGKTCDVIDDLTTIYSVGNYDADFKTLKECFDWLRNNCKIIIGNVIISINNVTGNDIMYIDDLTSLNHPYGNKISIEGNGINIISNTSSDYDYISDNDWVNIECGSNHTLAIKSDGTLWSTGSNYYGQLGLGDKIDRYGFTKSINNVKALSCGYSHSMIIKSDGTLWGTGYNLYGQLGTGNINNKLEFIQVGTDTDWFSVSCGSSHTLAIKSNGTLWVTGSNNKGELGLGDLTDRNVFTQVGTDNDWIATSGGLDYSCAIRSGGYLVVAGSNYYGNLGLGDNTDKLVFTPVGVDNDWVNIECGNNHTFAIKSDGTLWSTGYNYYGQLGLDNRVNRNIFTQVGNDTDWKTVSGGNSHTVAIKTNNTLWSTGYNAQGQLGTGDSFYKLIFTQEIRKDINWSFISCGGYHSISLKDTNSLWVVGYNGQGQLGTGDLDSLSIYEINKTLYLDVDDMERQNNIIILSDGHAIHNISNVNLLLTLTLNNISSGNIKPAYIFTTRCLYVVNNSSIEECFNITNIPIQTGSASGIGGEEILEYNPTTDKIFHVKNRSLINYYEGIITNNLLIENNSMVYVPDIAHEIITLKNKSVVLLDIDPISNNIVLINSKIIIRK